MSYLDTSPAIYGVKQQAAYFAFEDLIVIALETGNIQGARSRFQEAKEVLDDEHLEDLRELADCEYHVVLG